MPKCKDGKVPEGVNGRCVKACGPGQMRNAKGRCVNNGTKRIRGPPDWPAGTLNPDWEKNAAAYEKKKATKKKATTKKACTEGKVPEGANGRCVKPCGPGQMRNPKGRCVNDKSQKAPKEKKAATKRAPRKKKSPVKQASPVRQATPYASPVRQATPYASPVRQATPSERDNDIQIDDEIRQWAKELDIDDNLEYEVKDTLTTFRDTKYNLENYDLYESIEGDLSKSILEYTPEEFLELLKDDNNIFGDHEPHVILKYKSKYIKLMLDRVKFEYILLDTDDEFHDNYFGDQDDPQDNYIRFVNDVYTKYNMVLSPIMTNFIKAVIYHEINERTRNDNLKLHSSEGSDAYEEYDADGHAYNSPYSLNDYSDYKEYNDETEMEHPKIKGVNPNALGNDDGSWEN